MPEFWLKLWEWSPKVVPVLLKATVMSVQVTVGALIVALILGLVVALMRISPLRLLRYPALWSCGSPAGYTGGVDASPVPGRPFAIVLAI